MKRFLVAAAMAAFTFSAFALPSVDAVQAEISKGHLAQAEAMVREVIAARPDSARARYVHAELLAHEKHFTLAAEEAAQARRLDPSLSFTQPDKFNAFSALLDREQAAARGAVGGLQAHTQPVFLATPTPPAPGPGGVPGWAWAAAAGLLAVGTWRLLGARQAVPAGGMAPGMAGPGIAAMQAPAAAASGMPGQPMAYGMPAQPVSAGSGMLGTGLAVAGGVAAGMLAERLLDSRPGPLMGMGSAAAPAGLVPGLFEAAPALDPASLALEERPIDMGDGDGWGGGSGGGDVDTGNQADNGGW